VLDSVDELGGLRSVAERGVPSSSTFELREGLGELRSVELRKGLGELRSVESAVDILRMVLPLYMLATKSELEELLSDTIRGAVIGAPADDGAFSIPAARCKLPVDRAAPLGA